MVIYLTEQLSSFPYPNKWSDRQHKGIPAMCFPVNDLGTKLAKNVYAVNERVVVNINNDKNKICMVQ